MENKSFQMKMKYKCENKEYKLYIINFASNRLVIYSEFLIKNYKNLHAQQIYYNYIPFHYTLR